MLILFLNSLNMMKVVLFKFSFFVSTKLILSSIVLKRYTHSLNSMGENLILLKKKGSLFAYNPVSLE